MAQHVDPPNHSWVVGLIIEKRDDQDRYIPDTCTDVRWYLDSEPSFDEIDSWLPEGYVIVEVEANRSM